MITWIKRQLYNLGTNLSLGSQARLSQATVLSSRKGNHGLTEFNSDPLRLNIYFASGGTIVESCMVDRKTDYPQSKLHIVGPGDNLGESIEHIITIELLKK